MLAPFVGHVVADGGGRSPTVSIVVAAYQAAPYIAEAIESALDQTQPAEQIIVCDDGSTDDLLGALAPYLSRITLLRREHRGQSAARNRALSVAKSDFVSILDADDVLLPHYLEAVSALARRRPDLDIITTNAYVETGGRITGTYYPHVARFVVGDQRRGAMHNHFIFGLATIRTTRLLEVGGFDESLRGSEDTDCFLRIILAGGRAGLVDEPLARYRRRPGTVSADEIQGMQQGIYILERAAVHPSVTEAEREFLAGQLCTKRAEVRLRAAEMAARNGGPGAGARVLDAAFGALPPGHGLATRFKVLAAASPALMRSVGSALRPGPRSIPSG